jgi:hypothetical protein
MSYYTDLLHLNSIMVAIYNINNYDYSQDGQ